MDTDKLARAAAVFFATYGTFRGYQKYVSPKYPQWNLRLYWGKNQRRVHHYETGLYIAAIGLALFFEDLKDTTLKDELYQDVIRRTQKQEKQHFGLVHRQRWVPRIHRRGL